MKLSLRHLFLLPLAMVVFGLSLQGYAFESGSTGVDGPLNITEDTRLQLPENGVFNFTDVIVAADATLSFARNNANTPVTILASGDVTVIGAISVDGGDSPGTLDNIAEGLPGIGGPGGFDGGFGGFDSGGTGGTGLGPGGGQGGRGSTSSSTTCRGASGAFANSTADFSCGSFGTVLGGVAYGNAALQPLIGGSGGGGAILIAASGTVSINGSISATGGSSGQTGISLAGVSFGTGGGGGSGGAIRIVATTIAGQGAVSAIGGIVTQIPSSEPGSNGRILFEAENFDFRAQTTPEFFLTSPQPIVLADLPMLRITRVAGIQPSAPPGGIEVFLPLGLANPVVVDLESSGIPLGSVIDVSVAPENGNPSTVQSTALSGTVETATATASINIPVGHSTVSAQVSFTVTASIGDEMSRFAQGERVERIVLAAGMDGSSETLLITVSGKEYRYNGPLPAFSLSQSS